MPDLITAAWIDTTRASSRAPRGYGPELWSGAELTFGGSPHAVSRSGGTQTLRLRAGAGHAGRSYAILGSVTGTRPGMRLLGLQIPLHPDAYTSLAASGGPPVFHTFQGRLDASGGATASLALQAMATANCRRSPR